VFGVAPPSLVVRAIRTPRELEREGAEMRHCVATCANRIMSGTCAIYSVRIRGRRLTLEVVRRDDRWVLGDVKGRSHHRPGTRAWDALRPWLEQHRISRRASH
jgi:hypothetical protein